MYAEDWMKWVNPRTTLYCFDHSVITFLQLDDRAKGSDCFQSKWKMLSIHTGQKTLQTLRKIHIIFESDIRKSWKTSTRLNTHPPNKQTNKQTNKISFQ
jgi:hypothetical protein